MGVTPGVFDGCGIFCVTYTPFAMPSERATEKINVGQSTGLYPIRAMPERTSFPWVTSTRPTVMIQRGDL